jgi:hypothetical protein
MSVLQQMRFERLLLHKVGPPVTQPGICPVTGDSFPLQTKVGIDGQKKGVEPTRVQGFSMKSTIRSTGITVFPLAPEPNLPANSFQVVDMQDTRWRTAQLAWMIRPLGCVLGRSASTS